MLARLAAATEKLSNRARFVLAVVRGDLIVSNRKRADLLAELHDAGYKAFAAGDNDAAAVEMDEEDIEEAAAGGVGAAGATLGPASLAKRYAYLMNMPLWSLTLEKVEELKVRKIKVSRG